MFFSHKIILVALASLGALGLSAMEAKAAATTVAVFQDFDGTPCRIVAKAGVENFVQCHIRGVWTTRQTCAGDEHAAVVESKREEHRPFIRLIPRVAPKPSAQRVASVTPRQAEPIQLTAATSTSTDEAWQAARAADAAAKDALRAMREVHPSVAVAFKGF